MQSKRILLGISGGIAAYKIAYLIRLLKKSGAEVRCIMTPASCDFISPLVVATLSENPVGIEFWNKNTGMWANHVELGMWADIFIIAPLTANTLSKMANGACDNLLLATYLSAKCKTIVAPAMDLDMYKHATTKNNLDKINSFGVAIIPAEDGELASGLIGQGRMAEPETIFEHIENLLHPKNNSDSKQQEKLSGKQILITAGPTVENIDPVRFISNHSSGKMGYELAKECLKLGALVKLISGPVNIILEHENLEIIQIQTADELLIEVQKHWKKSDIGIFAAAVADFKVKNISETKIKKTDFSEDEQRTEKLTLELIKNPDILKWAGDNKTENQILVGFALETNDAEKNAQQKLIKKHLDFIVLNSLEDTGAGFATNTNKITIIDKHNNFSRFELKSKSEVATDILDTITKL